MIKRREKKEKKGDSWDYPKEERKRKKRAELFYDWMRVNFRDGFKYLLIFYGGEMLWGERGNSDGDIKNTR